MREKIKEIFKPSPENKRLTIENSHLAIFLNLITGSSFIEIAYFIWEKFGYLDIAAIVLETIFLFAGFIAIICGLLGKFKDRLKLLWISAIASVSLQIIFYPFSSGLQPYTILFLVVLFIILFAYVVLELRRGMLQKVMNFYSLELILFIFIFSFLIGVFYARYFPSDESAIDTYAARLFLMGINPYNPANMVSTLSIMHFPYYLGTPVLSGGYVQTLGYPALSFISYIPTAVFSIKPSLLQESLTVIPILILLVEYMRKGFLNLIPLLFLGIFSSTMILTEGLNGGNGFFWSSLVMLSFIFMRKPLGSGILFGLAISVKQLPLFVLPFFIILLLKDRKRSGTVKWIFGVIGTFLIINGYFILINPVFYIKSVLSPELSPLLGYGMGISQISFLRYADIPQTVFTVIMICSMVVLLAIYTLYFDRLKYALFVFPMIILAFNYRVAIEYFLYWVILCFSTIPFILDGRIATLRPDIPEKTHIASRMISPIKNPAGKKVVVAAVIMLCVIPVTFSFYHYSSNSRVLIESSVPQPLHNNLSYADSMNVTVHFSSNAANPHNILFRIVEPGPISNGNGLIWNISSNESGLMPNSTMTFVLHTDVPAEYLNLNESYMVVVYCAGTVSSRTFG